MTQENPILPGFCVRLSFNSKRLIFRAAILIGVAIAGGASITFAQQQSGVRASPWRPAFGAVDNSRQNLVPQAGDSRRGPNEPVSNSVAGSSAASGGTASIVNQPSQPTSPAATGFTDPLRSVQPNRRFGNSAAVRPGVTRVSKTLNQLPQADGQVWREYDITPYTSQVTSTDQPEKAVLDWVLRETGNEMWFTQPMGVLSVDKGKVYVYHTPEIQSVVKGIVDRFVRTKGQVQNFDVNLVTVTKPNWRSQAYTMLQPIKVQSPGVEAWLVSKENAAILMGQLSQRTDFRQHSSGQLTNHDGQSFSLDKTRPVQFIRSIRWTPDQVPNYQPLLSTLNEGYRLQLSSLTTMDNAAIEATIKCDVDQVEKLDRVKVAVPSPAGEQEVDLQIPQLVSWRLHERFRWPSDEVLVLSCGVVANPAPDSRTSGFRLPGISEARRADALLFIDYRGPATGATIAPLPRTAGAQRTASRLGRINN